MGGDNRKGDKPLPDNLDEILNERQKHTLRQMEGFGWHLEFVRRPLFQETVAAVCNAEGNKIGILEKNGNINLEPDITLRGQALDFVSRVKANTSG